MFKDKTILITGGTGSWGHELVRQLLNDHQPKEIRVFSRGEHKQVEMRQEFGEAKNLKFIIGDVRKPRSLHHAMKGVNIVFHLAALKHVPVCEEHSWEAVLTNIYGTQNVIEAAIDHDVETVVDISTDKAVDPFNLYGVTKACGEKLIINANNSYSAKTKFVCIRGGNVIGTNGSVIPLFKRQIQGYNLITITDPKMTRYLMSTRDAIGLVFQAVKNAVGGEVFVMRMPATTMEVVSQTMINLFGNKTTKHSIIGARPGEKLDEVLVSKNEAPRTKIINDQYYVILPQFANPKLDKQYGALKPIDHAEFTSRNAKQLTVESLSALLKKEDWLWR